MISRLLFISLVSMAVTVTAFGAYQVGVFRLTYTAEEPIITTFPSATESISPGESEPYGPIEVENVGDADLTVTLVFTVPVGMTMTLDGNPFLVASGGTVFKTATATLDGAAAPGEYPVDIATLRE